MQNDVRRAQFFIKFSYGSVDVVGEFAYLHEFLSPSHFKLKFENEYIKYSIGDENEIKKKIFPKLCFCYCNCSGVYYSACCYFVASTTGYQ